jgi:hypothetical protein
MTITLAERETPSFAYTLDTSKIPTKVVVASNGVDIYYQCPDKQWCRHLKAWQAAYAKHRDKAPQPMPFNHCMFAYNNIYGVTPIRKENS